MGRPTDNPRTEKVGFRLSKQEIEDIQKCADAMGTQRVNAIVAGIELLKEKLKVDDWGKNAAAELFCGSVIFFGFDWVSDFCFGCFDGFILSGYLAIPRFDSTAHPHDKYGAKQYPENRVNDYQGNARFECELLLSGQDSYKVEHKKYDRDEYHANNERNGEQPIDADVSDIFENWGRKRHTADEREDDRREDSENGDVVGLGFVQCFL